MSTPEDIAAAAAAAVAAVTGQQAEEKQPEAPPADPYAEAAERFRTTAKWLVTTFGALAAAIIAGLSLSDLGKLEGPDQVVAAFAVAVALISVIVIVVLAARVLASDRVPLADLEGDSPRNSAVAEALNRNPNLFGPHDNVKGFAAALNEQWKKQASAWEEMTTTDDAARKAAAEQRFAETKAILPNLNELNRRLLSVARHEQVRLRFESAMRWTTALALVAGIGITTFALVDTIAEKKDKPKAAVNAQPVTAIVDLTEEGEEELRSALGEKCNLDRVLAIAIGEGEKGVDLVSLPSADCKLARFTVAEEDGEVQAEQLDIPE